MIEFFDTSVLVAAGQVTHVHHERSFARIAATSQAYSFCAVHSYAEVYATMTALPYRLGLPPADVSLFIQSLQSRLTPVVLSAEDYLDTIKRLAERGLSSGKIYDALLLACAARSGAEVIYTWDLKHFRAIAPHLAERIQNP